MAATSVDASAPDAPDSDTRCALRGARASTDPSSRSLLAPLPMVVFVGSTKGEFGSYGHIGMCARAVVHARIASGRGVACLDPHMPSGSRWVAGGHPSWSEQGPWRRRTAALSLARRRVSYARAQPVPRCRGLHRRLSRGVGETGPKSDGCVVRVMEPRAAMKRIRLRLCNNLGKKTHRANLA